jgi:hypothetical protein
MGFVIIAAMFLIYPIFSLFSLVGVRIVEWIYNKRLVETFISRNIFRGFLILSIFPIHKLKPGNMELDGTLPLYMILTELPDLSHINFLYPSSLTMDGHGFVGAVPGILFKLIWLVLFFAYLFKLKWRNKNH